MSSNSLRMGIFKDNEKHLTSSFPYKKFLSFLHKDVECDP